MSSQTSLDAQSNARKERLAQLKSLKRKQLAEPESTEDNERDATEEAQKATSILSGRNYDIESGAPKLGFDQAPTSNQETLEARAAEIARETRKAKEEEEKSEKPIDLFSLQPKKPNWDLKRDVDVRLERLEMRTNSAIARLVRERILAAKGGAEANGEEEATGVEGDLADVVRRKEQEVEEDSKMEDDGDL